MPAAPSNVGKTPRAVVFHLGPPLRESTHAFSKCTYVHWVLALSYVRRSMKSSPRKQYPHRGSSILRFIGDRDGEGDLCPISFSTSSMSNFSNCDFVSVMNSSGKLTNLDGFGDASAKISSLIKRLFGVSWVPSASASGSAVAMRVSSTKAGQGGGNQLPTNSCVLAADAATKEQFVSQ